MYKNEGRAYEVIDYSTETTTRPLAERLVANFTSGRLKNIFFGDPLKTEMDLELVHDRRFARAVIERAQAMLKEVELPCPIEFDCARHPTNKIGINSDDGAFWIVVRKAEKAGDKPEGDS